MTEPLDSQVLFDKLTMALRQQVILGGIQLAQIGGLTSEKAAALRAQVLAGNIDQVYADLEAELSSQQTTFI